ncbi:MAG: beta strand repeat-containing protein, partial [Ilumatobacteraceae bacterium]
GTGTFDAVTFTIPVGTVTLQGAGILTASGAGTGILTGAAYDLQSGTVNFPNATGGLGGAVTVTKTTGGTVTLTSGGLGSFNNAVSVNAGTLEFSSSAQFGLAGGSNTVTVNGGALSYTPVGTPLSLPRTVAVGASNGTVNVLSSTSTLTVASVTSAGGDLVKTGPGTLTVSGVTVLNGGAAGVRVNDGTLVAGFGTSGISTIDVGATGNLNMNNGLIEALTLGNTAGALTLAGGAGLGFELTNTGTNDSIAATTLGATAVASGTITLNFFGTVAAGTYTLLTANSGLTSGGATYALGSAPNGFNYTINPTDSLVTVVTSAYTPIYWRGGQNNSWATLGASTANWTPGSAGTVDATATPAPIDTVIFSAAGTPAVSNTITTTLDGTPTVDSIQFTNVPAGISAVNISRGTSGSSLTIIPASTSGGIRILTGGGNATFNSDATAYNLNIGASQTWDVAGSASTLAINADVTFGGFAVNKTGAGAVTLAGTNAGAGTLTLASGTLNINSAAALGGTSLVINGGAAIDNGSSAGITLSTTNPQTWNGDFTFAGTRDLTFGTGAITLTNPLTVITTNGVSTLAQNGAVGQTGSNRALTKAGTGTLVLNGNSTYTGLTTVNAGVLTLAGDNTAASGGVALNAGTLNVNSPTALGAGGTFTIAGGTLGSSSLGAVASTTNNPVALNGNFTFAGPNDLNLGTGAITPNATRTITLTAGTLTMGANIGGTFGLTTAGT